MFPACCGSPLRFPTTLSGQVGGSHDPSLDPIAAMWELTRKRERGREGKKALLGQVTLVVIRL